MIKFPTAASCLVKMCKTMKSVRRLCVKVSSHLVESICLLCRPEESQSKHYARTKLSAYYSQSDSHLVERIRLLCRQEESQSRHIARTKLSAYYCQSDSHLVESICLPCRPDERQPRHIARTKLSAYYCQSDLSICFHVDRKRVNRDT